MSLDIDTSALYSHDIEQSLLGILLRNNTRIENLPDFFSDRFFYDPLHQRIYAAIATLVQKGRLANALTLVQYFKDEKSDGDAQEYIRQIASVILPSDNVAEYGQHVFDFYLRRQLVDLGHNLASRVSTAEPNGPTPHQHIEETEHGLFQLAQWGVDRGPVPLSSAVNEAILLAEKAYKCDRHVVGVGTGLREIDKMLGGFHPSDLVIVAGRPSMGKTAFVTNIAFHAAKQRMESKGNEGASVAFFSLEMSSSQLAMRLLGQETGISSDRIRRGAIDQEAFPRFLQASRQMNDIPLFIDDTPALSISGLLSRCRRLKRKENIGMVVVDYLQLLTTKRSSHDNRVQELSEITRGLKALAKELNVPVIALSQLSRYVEQREDKRPLLSDLRESGTIEQDADVVMFLYREEYYESRKKPGEGSEAMAIWQKNMSHVYNKAEVIIAKQRHGPIGNVALHFDSPHTKFSDLAPAAYAAAS